MVQGLSNTGAYGANGYGYGAQPQAEAQSNGNGGTVGATVGLLGSAAYMGFARKYNMTGSDFQNLSDEKFNKIVDGFEDKETQDTLKALKENIKSVPDVVKQFAAVLPKDAEGFVSAENYKDALKEGSLTIEEQIKAYETELEALKGNNDKTTKSTVKFLTSYINQIKQQKDLIDNAKDGKIKFEDITKLETKFRTNIEMQNATAAIKNLGKEAPKVKLYENFKDIGKLKKAGIAVAVTAVVTGLIGKLFNSDTKEAPAQEQTAEAPAAQGQLAEAPQAPVQGGIPQAPAFAGAPVAQAPVPTMPQQPIAPVQAALPTSVGTSPLDAPIGNPYAVKPGFCAQA